MRAMLVDDEALALRGLTNQLNKIDGIRIVGSYQVAEQALEASRQLKPDVVFLDIDMPEMNGLEAAERFQDLNPSIEVVFVTAYEGYAVKAFELQAIDYLLKPVQTSRLALSVQRVAGRLQESAANRPDRSAAAQTTRIQVFERLQIVHSNQETFSWRTVKAQELFAYLLARKGQPVRKDKLVDILWPEVDYKKAYTQLYTTIYQLRKSLEAAAVPILIVNSSNSYSLDLGGLAIDAEEWEAAVRLGDEMDSWPAETCEDWLYTYKGDYLEEHGFVWAEGESERLRGLWLSHAFRFSRRLAESGDAARASTWLHRIQARYPHFEEPYFQLMKLYAGLGERSQVIQQYAKLETMLRTDLGAEPADAIQQWYAKWKQS